jgi:hypothetical protein
MVRTLKIGTLLNRIRRKLAHDHERLCKARGNPMSPENLELGSYFIVDWDFNSIVAKHVDPEELGRELGLLRPGETVLSPGSPQR